MALETLKNNRYRILRPLGSGSTGEVYLVEDNLNNRQEVAFKLLHAYAYPLQWSLGDLHIPPERDWEI